MPATATGTGAAGARTARVTPVQGIAPNGKRLLRTLITHTSSSFTDMFLCQCFCMYDIDGSTAAFNKQ
jgi:hypothetical protein